MKQNTPLTPAEKQARYRARKAEREETEWQQKCDVVIAAANLCKKAGLPFETHDQLAASLKALTKARRKK